MMTRTIKIGDKVKLCYTTIPNFTDTPVFNAIVLHTPSDVGDSWHFKDEFGTTFAQNPVDSNLGQIVLVEEAQRG